MLAVPDQCPAENQTASPSFRSCATSLKSNNSKETLKAWDAHVAPVAAPGQTIDPVTKNIVDKGTPIVGETNELGENHTLNDDPEKQILAAGDKPGPEGVAAFNPGTTKEVLAGSDSEGSERKLVLQDPKRSSNTLNPRDVWLKASREGSELGKEIDVDLEARRGSSFYSEHEKDEHEKDEQEKDKPVTQVVDPNVVDWDGPDDPQNARNWSPALKKGNIAIMSAITFLTYDHPSANTRMNEAH